MKYLLSIVVLFFGVLLSFASQAGPAGGAKPPKPWGSEPPGSGVLTLRVYVPADESLESVKLPTVVIEYYDGSTKELLPCKKKSLESLRSYIKLVTQKPVTCSWGVAINDPNKFNLNVALPEKSATYFNTVLNIDETVKRFVIKGEYPNARYFSITPYTNTLASLEEIVKDVNNPMYDYPLALADYQINPDSGYVNPFQEPAAHGGKYTVYLVNKPEDAPANGNVLPMPPNDPGSLADLFANLPNVVNCYPEEEAPESCNPMKFFLPFPEYSAAAGNNPTSGYLMSFLKYVHGTVILVRGKLARVAAGTAPVIWPNSRLDMRFFSFCNYLAATPYPYLKGDYDTGLGVDRQAACVRDDELILDSQGYYHVVISRDKPVRSGHNWVPMSKSFKLADRLLLVRNMNVDPQFPHSVQKVTKPGDWEHARDVMAEYYPDLKRCRISDYQSMGFDCPALPDRYLK